MLIEAQALYLGENHFASYSRSPDRSSRWLIANSAYNYLNGVVPMRRQRSYSEEMVVVAVEGFPLSPTFAALEKYCSLLLFYLNGSLKFSIISLAASLLSLLPFFGLEPIHIMPSFRWVWLLKNAQRHH
jgi:hypothetical protein